MNRAVRTTLIVYLVILHLLVLLLLTGRGRRFVPILRQQDEARKSAHFQSQMLGFYRRIDEMAEPGSILFVGDSGIQGMNLQRLEGRALNFGIGGDTSEGVLQRLPTYASLKTASVIVISIGFNDLKAGLEDRTIWNIEAILEQLPIGLAVVVCSICEVDESKHAQGINERIRDLNSDLKVLIADKGNVKYLDVANMLRQKFAGRKESYHEVDGVHLNCAGRAAWLNAVAGAVARVLESEAGTE